MAAVAVIGGGRVVGQTCCVGWARQTGGDGVRGRVDLALRRRTVCVVGYFYVWECVQST